MDAREILLLDIGTAAGDLPVETPVPTIYGTWFPVPHVAEPVPAPEDVDTTPVADGVLLEWAAVEGAEIYIIARGPAEVGPWTEVARTTDTRYLYSDGSGGTWYFKITASVRGRVGDGAVTDEESPRQTPDIDELVELQTALDAEVESRVAGDIAEAAARGAAVLALAAADAALAQDLLDEAAARGTAITTLQSIMESADESLAQEIAQVSAGSGEQFDPYRIWYFDADLESWHGGGSGTPTIVDGWLRPANGTNTWVQSPTGLTIDASAYRFVKARVRRVGNPPWEAALRWLRAGEVNWAAHPPATIPEPAWNASGIGTLEWDNIEWLGAPIDRIRLDMSHTQTDTDYFLIDFIAVGRPTPGAGVAALQDERSARISGDATNAGQITAESTARQTLATQLRGDYAGSDLAGLTTGLLHSERTARSSGDAANAAALASEVTARETLQASIAGNGVNLLPDRYSTFPTLPPLHARAGTGTHAVDTSSPMYAGALVLSATSANMGVGFSPASNEYNIDSSPGQHIVSFWAWTPSGTCPVQVYLYAMGGTVLGGATITANTTKTRYSVIVDTTSAGQTKHQLRLDNDGGSGAVVRIDGVMVERRVGAGTTPSPYTRGNTGAGLVSLTATVASESSARASGDTALASQINAVRATLGGGANLLRNSGFESDTTGWHLGAGTTGGYTYEWISNNGNWPGEESAQYIPAGFRGVRMRVPAQTFPGGTMLEIHSENIPTAPGKKHIFSVYYNAFRSQARIYIVYVNAAGVALATPSNVGAANAANTPVNLADLVRLDVAGTAPAGTANVRVYLHLLGVAQYDPAIWFMHPMLEEVPADKTSPSPYQPGAQGLDAKYAAATQSMTAEIGGVDGRVRAMHTVALDVDGNVSGHTSENDGTTSSFSVLATVFRVISSLVGMGMEWQDGYLRIWKGAAQLIIGHTFGVTGDMVFWYGPNIGAAACTKANGKIWFDNAADAYFGGTLRAGTLYTAVRYVLNQLNWNSADYMTLIHAGSAGNPKSIVRQCGLVISSTHTGNVTGSYPTRTATMRLRVWRGATLLSTVSITASSSAIYDSEANTTLVVQAWSFPSLTLTDSSTGTGDITYRMQLDFTSGTYWDGVWAGEAPLSITEE